MTTLNDPRPWLVWSNEHVGWWLPMGLGYTQSLQQAGRFTAAEAREAASDDRPLPNGERRDVMILSPQALDEFLALIPPPSKG